MRARIARVDGQIKLINDPREKEQMRTNIIQAVEQAVRDYIHGKKIVEPVYIL